MVVHASMGPWCTMSRSVKILLIFVIGGVVACAVDNGRQDPEPNIPSFQSGEATGLVQTWLGNRPWSDQRRRLEWVDIPPPPPPPPPTPCPPNRTCFPPRPSRLPMLPTQLETRIESIVSNCLTYHQQKSLGGFTERFLGDGVWVVENDVDNVGLYRWRVFETSLSINTTESPPDSNC
jgi:hypothetical protein